MKNNLFVFFMFLLFTFTKYVFTIEIPFTEKMISTTKQDDNFNANVPLDLEHLLTKELKLNIGTPFAQAKFTLDSGSHVTWVYTSYSTFNKYDPKTSSSYQNYKDTLSLQYGSLKTTVDLGSDIMKIDGIDKTFSFTFGTTSSVSGTKTDGIIGLPYYNREGSDYDFLNALKNSNIIQSSKFAITYNPNKDGEGNIFIDEYPPELQQAKNQDKAVGKCDILALGADGIRGVHFNCLLDGMMRTSDESSYREINDILIVDSGTTFNYVSDEMFSLIKEKYRKLGSSECDISYSSITCKKNSYPELEPIYFVFEDKAIQVDLSNCFYPGLSNFESCFQRTTSISLFGPSIGNILGASFIKQIISVHDRDNQIVEFYAKDKILSLSKNYSHNKLSRKAALIVSIIIYVLSIAAIVVLRLKVMKFETSDITSDNYILNENAAINSSRDDFYLTGQNNRPLL